MKNHIIAVTGGIGSGKSVICQILKNYGYQIYNCDIKAKTLMDNSISIKSALSNELSPTVINNDGNINRKILSDIVFNDKDKLNILNKIVHFYVKEDIIQWIKENTSNLPPSKLFIETAILYQSGIDKIVDEVWEITASEETRINRVIKRNGLSRTEVISRIKSQAFIPSKIHPKTKTIINDSNKPILPQLIPLLET